MEQNVVPSEKQQLNMEYSRNRITVEKIRRHRQKTEENENIG